MSGNSKYFISTFGKNLVQYILFLSVELLITIMAGNSNVPSKMLFKGIKTNREKFNYLNIKKKNINLKPVLTNIVLCIFTPSTTIG